MKKLTTFLLCLALAAPVMAREIDGVNVAAKLALAGEKTELALNGAGLRTRYLVKVYVAGLYLTQPATTADEVLNSGALRVMAIHMRRDTDSEQTATAFLTSVVKNHDRKEMQALQDRLNAFKLMMPSMKRNDVLRLEFLTNGDTRVTLNGAEQGVLKGADFQRALLRIWLGHTPVDEKLKQALLGGK
jgi:long-chain acyl-CoA synthetase